MTKGVFLGQKAVSVKENGKDIERQLGEFHQPKSQDNRTMPVLLPKDAKLTQYQEYAITGELKQWAFNNQANYRISAIEIRPTEKK